MEQLTDQIRIHPWRSLITGALSVLGVVTGLNQLFGLEWQYCVVIMLAYAIGFFLFYAGITYDRVRVRCFDSQPEAGPAILQAVKEARRSVKILSFTSETIYNLFSQGLIEELLDRGVELKVLIAAPESRYYLRDDPRDKYEEIIRTYVRRWTDLVNPRRRLQIRVYDSIPLLRGVIVDEEQYFIGSYFHPTFDVGDINYLFAFRGRPKMKYEERNPRAILSSAFDYLWSYSRPPRPDEASLLQPRPTVTPEEAMGGK